MPLRYNNEQSAQVLKDIEAVQGNSWLPRSVYLHTDKKGFKRLYMLSPLQRVFMFYEDPNFSTCKWGLLGWAGCFSIGLL